MHGLRVHPCSLCPRGEGGARALKAADVPTMVAGGLGELPGTHHRPHVTSGSAGHRGAGSHAGLCLTPWSQQDRGGDRTNSDTDAGQASALTVGSASPTGREPFPELAVAVDAEHTISRKAHGPLRCHRCIRGG